MRLWLDQTLSPCKKTRLDQTLEKYMCLLLDQTLSTCIWQTSVCSMLNLDLIFDQNVFKCLNMMAELNVPAQAPTRTDEQIISVDILCNTNFFRVFSASTSVPAVYIQQFWNSMKTVMGRVYSRDSVIISHRQSHEASLKKDLIRKAGELSARKSQVYLESSARIFPKEKGDDLALELAKKMSKGKAIGNRRTSSHSQIGSVKEDKNYGSVDPCCVIKHIFGFRQHGPSSKPEEDDTSEKVVHESSSTTDSEGTERVSIPVCTQDQAGSDPGKAHEALAGPDPEPMQEDQTGSDSGKVHVSLAGPNPEHMDEEFLATAYPKVHENLKLITDECVFEDNPESNSGSMSSMKNLEDTDNFGDQFLYDKPTEDDQEKNLML
ncbi:hypothetical protein Tco_0481136 [Tanacetum coccineum]